MKKVALYLITLVLLSSCITDKVLNYALKRDAKRDVVKYEKSFNRQSHKSSEDSLWFSTIHDTTIVSDYNAYRLHGIFRYADKPTSRTCVLFHGYKGNATTMLDMAKFYSDELGCNVLLPDFHAHGLSEGKMIQMGWLDRWDLIQWVRIANQLFALDGKDTEMIVTGVSMGGAATMMISGEVEEQNLSFIKCLVEDCGYSNVYDQFAHVSKGKYGWVLKKADKRCKKKYGWSFKEASSLEQLKKCNLPMLFIHGGADTYVPTAMVYELYDAKKGEKELWVPKGVSHAASFSHRNIEYRQRVKSFVSKFLEQ